jgi:hypothetical protein
MPASLLQALRPLPWRIAAPSALTLEELHGTLVLLGCLARPEGTEIAALTRFRILLARVKPILA